MRINMVIDRGAMRRWHVDLAERLRGDGHAVHFSTADGADEALPHLALLEMFERLVYRLPADDCRARERIAQSLDQSVGEGADLVIDLTARPSLGAADLPTLVPVIDGACDEAAAVAALLDRRSPSLAVVLRGNGDGARLAVTGMAALEEPACLTASLARICGRTGDLLQAAVRRFAAGAIADEPVEQAETRPIARFAPARFAIAGLNAKIAARLTGLARRADHWRIGWRATARDAIAETLQWPQRDFAFLHDDAARYYADPCIFVEDGVAYVFCEEFPYATRKGIISVFTIGRDGTVGRPRPVLEDASHLSYPMVFRHGGAIWMIPESSAKARIELYRAERFPDRWTHAATLVENVAASDATLVAHGGRLWLFAAIAEAGASSWDTLGLFHAASLEGPWSPHPANPVIIDASAARPAGMMFEHRGRLIRPAQDCRSGYGAGLAFCMVDRLDTEGFAQRVVRRFAPPAAWHAHGLHTYNRAAGLEVVDCLGTRQQA